MSPTTDQLHRLEPFETGGQPVHSRTLVVDLQQEAHGRVSAHGTILDLRKHGWVPTGGELQTAGIIHHMSLDASVDAASRRIERFEPSQQVVAFEPSERTAGDSCRDPIHRLRVLEGQLLDAGCVRRLRESFGGPLGCSHLLTLAQLMVSMFPGVLERELESEAVRKYGRQAGERLFKRVIFIDGFERSDGDMEVAIQLTDIQTAPFAGMHGILDRFASQHEVRVLAKVDIASMNLSLFDAAERIRARSELGQKVWQSRRELLAPFVGHPVMHGLAPELLRRLGGDPAHQTLLEALLNFAPGLIQCLATRASRMIEQSAGGPGRLRIPKEAGIGGFPNSCYIWRSEGKMTQVRQARVQATEDADFENVED